MKIRIGTRSSALALAQTKIVTENLLLSFPNLEIEIVEIKTTGDILYDRPLVDIGGKALFIKEIEEALLEKKIDIAVHSMKDMPVDLPNGLKIGCVLERQHCEDAFISAKYDSLGSMDSKAIIGTCSSRRKVLLQRMRPDVTNVVDLRGNVVTRLKKMFDGEVDALILAVSGLKRLKAENVIKEVIDPEKFFPAVAQGIICVELRQHDKKLCSMLKKLNHRETWIQSVVERSFLKFMGGDCKTPIGIYTSLTPHVVSFKAFTFMNEIYEEYNNYIKLDNKRLISKDIEDRLKRSLHLK